VENREQSRDIGPAQVGGDDDRSRGSARGGARRAGARLGRPAGHAPLTAASGSTKAIAARSALPVRRRSGMVALMEQPTLLASCRSAAGAAAGRDWGIVMPAGIGRDELLPRMVGQVSLALALSAYDEWLRDPRRPLLDLAGKRMTLRRDYLAVV